MHLKKTALASIATSALALCAAPALGATSGDGTSQGKSRAVGGPDLSGEISAALQRDLGLSASHVKEQRALQAKAIKLDQTLQDSLGSAYAGSSYNTKAGKLVVMVSDAARASKARAAGADVRVVKHSKAKLDAIKDALDVAAGKRGSGPADREANGARQATVAGMTSWYVDTSKNTVHVTVDKAHADEAARSLAKYGDAVTIVESDQAPVPTDRYQDGGDAINSSSCSTGFNLRNPSTGQGYLLTAGHCVSTGSTLYGHDTTWWGMPIAFGPVLESWFPGADDALARNDTGHYIQGPWVDANPSHGGVITTSSYTDAPVNTWICKSGITTKWTCGQITGKDQTVTYPGYGTVYGLTRHNACVEPGDSGGANVSVTNAYRAEGVTSGAYLYGGRCGSAYGYSNVSYYFPIADSLAYYRPKYGVTVW